MRRREFIILLGGTAATIALPLAARAQKPERMRRIGVLMSLAENDPEGQARIAAFLQALQQLGWIDGRNLRVDTRWAAGNADHNRDYANELVALAPLLGVEVRPIDVRDAGEIERAVAAFAREPNGGLIVPTNALAILHRKLIITLAAQHQLPAVYPARYYVTDGGLICYGPDAIDQYRRVAGYADRILKGEKPAELPVQAPTKYELAVNLKTAKALGLVIPDSVLARADEVIE